MQATTALVADAAAVHDGKLFIHGGGWDVLNVQSLPATHPALALVVVIRVEYDEALREFPFTIELLDEDDNAMGVEAGGFLAVGHAATGARGAPSFAPLVLPIANLQLSRAGGYRFKVSVGDQELASIPFRVRVAPQHPRTQARPG